MTATIVFYATDSMADWEYGYVLAGLNLAESQGPGRFRVVVAAEDGVTAVRSLGGLTVVPETGLSDLPTEIAAIVLPGATTWADGHGRVLELAGGVLAAGGVVAAICGATLGLARVGLLDARAHTSNAPDYLAGTPGYAGEQHYREARAVRDGGLITAPATAPVDFAREVFAALDVFPPAVLDAWYGLYTTGERRHFEALFAA